MNCSHHKATPGPVWGSEGDGKEVPRAETKPHPRPQCWAGLWGLAPTERGGGRACAGVKVGRMLGIRVVQSSLVWYSFFASKARVSFLPKGKQAWAAWLLWWPEGRGSSVAQQSGP